MLFVYTKASSLVIPVFIFLPRCDISFINPNVGDWADKLRKASSQYIAKMNVSGLPNIAPLLFVGGLLPLPIKKQKIKAKTVAVRFCHEKEDSFPSMIFVDLANLHMM